MNEFLYCIKLTSDCNSYIDSGREDSIHLFVSFVDLLANKKHADVSGEKVDGFASRDNKRPLPVVRLQCSTCSISPDGNIILTVFIPFFGFFLGSILSF